MDTVTINNPVQTQFAMVPNSLWAMPISCTAKAIFAYLLSFRDQTCVRVALIEQTLGLGRDKRQKAMRELEDAALIERKIERHRGRIVTRELIVTTEPLLRQMVQKLAVEPDPENLGPENQALGSQTHLGPEKPAVGKSGPVVSETGSNCAAKSGPLYKTNTKKPARAAKPRGAGRSATQRDVASRPAVKGGELPTEPQALNAYVRTCLRQDKPVLVAGRMLQPQTPEHLEMKRLAEKGVAA